MTAASRSYTNPGIEARNTGTNERAHAFGRRNPLVSGLGAMRHFLQKCVVPIFENGEHGQGKWWEWGFLHTCI
jgi:hypothetical protein